MGAARPRRPCAATRSAAKQHARAVYGQGVVLEAVRRNGLALRHASGALRADRHVVLCAIRECPMSLEHAHAPRMMRGLGKDVEAMFTV